MGQAESSRAACESATLPCPSADALQQVERGYAKIAESLRALAASVASARFEFFEDRMELVRPTPSVGRVVVPEPLEEAAANASESECKSESECESESESEPSTLTQASRLSSPVSPAALDAALQRVQTSTNKRARDEAPPRRSAPPRFRTRRRMRRDSDSCDDSDSSDGCT